MNGWLVWSLIVLAWSVVFSVLGSVIDEKGMGWFTAFCITVLLGSLISLALWGTVFALQWYQVWPFIPQ